MAVVEEKIFAMIANFRHSRVSESRTTHPEESHFVHIGPQSPTTFL